ncbi:MAG: cytochrome b N-terminal domain-containing protein [Xanthomonadales bacterium]|nr:cytochrome b N-terminal domain-containing protein [Xanthomonadales bacterium]
MKIFQSVRSSIRSGSPYAGNDPDDPRKYLKNFLLHFRPTAVPERALSFTLTWALGLASTVLLVLLMASGFLLKFVYEPTPVYAYDSIVHLGRDVPFGQLLRNMHRWSGYALLMTAFLHLLRVFYTSAFHAPRQFNWIIGLGLFTVIVLSNFTGYLLPWDQISYWAITISTSLLDYVPWIGTTIKSWILGGPEPGPATLMNFYAIHTAVLPVMLLFALPFHFWRIRKANGIVIQRAPDEELPLPLPMVNTVPHLVSREIAMTFVVLAAILAVSMVFNAPLAEQANPGMSPNPTKAPWYFMGIQEILMHFHPLFAALIIPATLTAGLLYLPYISYDADTRGVWFCSRKGRKLAFLAAVVAIALTVGLVLLDDLVLSVNTPSPPNLVRNGLLPFLAMLAIGTGVYALARRRLAASKNEAVQAVFTLVMVSFITLTVIGIWFRGAGMQLMWAG